APGRYRRRGPAAPGRRRHVRSQAGRPRPGGAGGRLSGSTAVERRARPVPADEAQRSVAADNGAMTEEAVRLNKHIAGTGFCSRREADRLIAERRVTVNGQPAGVGAVVGEGDEVRVDGQPLKLRAARPGKRRHVYIALNKPVGITCTTESSVKGNIVD